MPLAFRSMPDWFDRLPPSEQEAYVLERSLAEAQLPPDNRLLPLAHGEDLPSRLAAAEAAFLATPEPRGLIRIGDSELGLLSGGLPTHGASSLELDMRWGGYRRSAYRLRPLFIEAIEAMPIVGVHHDQPAWRHRTALVLLMLGLPFPYGVDVHFTYSMLLSGALVHALGTKSIVLVGHKAPALHVALGRSDFLDAAQVFGPVDKLRVLSSFSTPDYDTGADGCFESLLKACETSSADAFVLSCGLLAKPLAYALWKQGRTALDIGHVVDALLGSYEAPLRPALKTFAWPAFWQKAGIVPVPHP